MLSDDLQRQLLASETVPVSRWWQRLWRALRLALAARLTRMALKIVRKYQPSLSPWDEAAFRELAEDFGEGHRLCQERALLSAWDPSL